MGTVPHPERHLTCKCVISLSDMERVWMRVCVARVVCVCLRVYGGVWACGRVDVCVCGCERGCGPGCGGGGVADMERRRDRELQEERERDDTVGVGCLHAARDCRVKGRRLPCRGPRTVPTGRCSARSPACRHGQTRADRARAGGLRRCSPFARGVLGVSPRLSLRLSTSLRTALAARRR